MIWFTIKFFCAFIVSFLLLSINVSKKPLFYHLKDLVGPLGSDISESVSRSFDRTVDKSSDLGKSLFDNSAPKGNSKALKAKRDKIQEDIKASEQKRLDQVIEKD